MSKMRLQLTWYNKDMALIPTESGRYGYRWVSPADPRYCETHTFVNDEYISGHQSEKTDAYLYSDRADLQPQEDNLLVLGESGDVLEALTRVPELAEKYVGKVKLVYIDPPFNTAKTFDLLNAGAALFVDCGINELEMARFATDERLTFNDIKRYTGSIIDLADKAIVYIADAMDWRVEFDGSLERKEIPEIPVDAIREAVINAFAHRIIESRQSVDVSIYKSFVEIYSPGKFPEGIQPEQFIMEIRKPIRRNPLITRTLYYSKDMESFATGLKRIHDACNDAGVKVEFRGDAYGFTVRFYRHCGEGWAEVVHSKDKNAQADAQADAQVKSIEDRIVEFCKTAHTMKDIQMMLGVKDIRTARKYVRILIEKQSLVMSNPESPTHPDQKYTTVS